MGKNILNGNVIFQFYLSYSVAQYSLILVIGDPCLQGSQEKFLIWTFKTNSANLN